MDDEQARDYQEQEEKLVDACTNLFMTVPKAHEEYVKTVIVGLGLSQHFEKIFNTRRAA